MVHDDEGSHQQREMIAPCLFSLREKLRNGHFFLERNTFQQSVGIAAVQLPFGVFMFATEPSISPVVDLHYKLGVANQQTPVFPLRIE